MSTKTQFEKEANSNSEMAYYLEKLRGSPYFSLWIPKALVKIYFMRVVLTWRENVCI